MYCPVCNFSAVVAEALKEYLRSRKVEKAMSSFGKWELRDKGSVDIDNDIRKEGITLTSIDCLDNATAVVRGHKIATRNKDHYPDNKILLPLK